MTDESDVLRELLKKPFGPYLDEDVLSPECKYQKHAPIKLRDVMFECEGEPTGLTFCEDSQPEYDRDKFQRSVVRVRGILKISSSSWLSETGLKLLENELRQRDYDSRRALQGSRAAKSNLKLEKHVFRPQNGKPFNKHPMILIQTCKKLPCVYLTSEVVPEGLALHTEHCKRVFQIASMDPETYVRSRLYLWRFRALYEIRKIMDISFRKPPLRHRTPKWFAEQYVDRIVPEPYSQQRRLIYLSDNDSDIEPDTGGQLKEDKTHRLRHISHAEILSLFAMHARWLVANQREQLHGKYFDPDVWETWYLQSVKAWRVDAKKSGYSWGVMPRITHEDGVHSESDAMDSDDEDEDAMEVDQSLGYHRTSFAYRGKGKRRAVLPRIMSPQSREMSPEIELDRPVAEDEFTASTSRSFQVHYDSDYSTASSSSASSDTESLSSSTSLHPKADEDHIPRALFYPPQLPLNSYSWQCPLEECQYEIDLWCITDENRRGISPEDLERIEKRRCSSTDRESIICFNEMVSAHYKDHLRAFGYETEEMGIVRKFRRIEAPRHPPSPRSGSPTRQSVVKDEARD